MRLAQIARKLKVKSTEVVAFIEQKFEVQIPHAPYTKIPDEFVGKIIKHFAPTETENHVIEETEKEVLPSKELKEEETIQTQEELTKESDVESVLEAKKEIHDESHPEESTQETVELNIEDGVIKAPKVEVEGDRKSTRLNSSHVRIS